MNGANAVARGTVAAEARTAFWTGLGGGAMVLSEELWALGAGGRGVWWLAAALLGAVGLAIGAVVWSAELAIARLRPGVMGRALLRASGAALPLAFVGRHLFDGGFASTLPGAAMAAIWVPILGVFGLAALLAAGEWILTAGISRVSRVRYAAASVALLAFAIATEHVNRTRYRTEYPDVHTFLVVVACAAGALGLRLGLPLLRRTAAGRRAPLADVALVLLAAAIIGGTIAAAHRPLDRAARWALATRGMHARLLYRLLRSPKQTDSKLTAASVVTSPPPSDDGSLAHWRQSPEITTQLAAARHGHVLLLLVDALRADMLTPTPENRHDFPNLLALRDGARRFTRAFAPASGTDVSVSSVVAGRIDPFRRLDTTLIEALRAGGRRTHAVLPTEMLRWVGTALVTRGLDSFDRLVNDQNQRDTSDAATGPRTTELGLAFLDRRAAEHDERPFFLWLHYFDVHEHHEIEARDPDLCDAVVAMGRAADRASAARLLRRDVMLKYRATVAIVDREVGRLLDDLSRRGLQDRTTIVLMADHGESLGEDPRLPDHHGDLLYEPLVRVPLILRVPGVAPGDVEDPVTLIDLTPTLLELAGAPPLPLLDGTSLLPALLPGAPHRRDTRALVLNETRQRGIVRWPYKLLERPADDLQELYDLEADPGERRDLAAERPELVEELSQLYRRFPAVRIDRSFRGRRLREQLAVPPGGAAVP